MKAAEDQVVEDDARFQDDEVGLGTKKIWLGREINAIYFRIIIRFSESTKVTKTKSAE